MGHSSPGGKPRILRTIVTGLTRKPAKAARRNLEPSFFCVVLFLSLAIRGRGALGASLSNTHTHKHIPRTRHVAVSIDAFGPYVSQQQRQQQLLHADAPTEILSTLANEHRIRIYRAIQTAARCTAPVQLTSLTFFFTPPFPGPFSPPA